MTEYFLLEGSEIDKKFNNIFVRVPQKLFYENLEEIKEKPNHVQNLIYYTALTKLLEFTREEIKC